MQNSKIRFLGTIQLRNSSNKELAFRRRKTIALLSYLLLYSKKVSREYLAALSWPDLDHKNSRNNLRVALSRLNSTLGSTKTSLFLSDRQNIQFNPEQHIFLDVKPLLLISPKDSSGN